MSGAAATLKRLLNQLENIKNEIETKILPAVERLEEIDRRFTKLSNWHNKRQKDELEWRGYTFLSREQSKIMIDGRVLNVSYKKRRLGESIYVELPSSSISLTFIISHCHSISPSHLPCISLIIQYLPLNQ